MCTDKAMHVCYSSQGRGAHSLWLLFLQERLPEEQPGVPERLGVWEYRTVQVRNVALLSFPFQINLLRQRRALLTQWNPLFGPLQDAGAPMPNYVRRR